MRWPHPHTWLKAQFLAIRSIDNQVDHRQPVPGHNGIQLVPTRLKSADAVAALGTKLNQIITLIDELRTNHATTKTAADASNAITISKEHDMYSTTGGPLTV